MQENNFINSALKVIQIEGKAILGLQDQIEETFNDLCTNILATKGKLILMGIGKSGHIAQKISATLSSTGTPSFFIHPTEAAHGDLGMIDKKDAILILSNSGETKEIIEILPALKRCAGSIFTLTNNADSTIAKIGDINILIKANEEACPLDLAPTSSTTLAHFRARSLIASASPPARTTILLNPRSLCATSASLSFTFRSLCAISASLSSFSKILAASLSTS